MKNVSVKTSLKTEKSYFTKLLDNYPPAVYGGLYQLARYDSVKSKAFFDDACCFKNDIWNCNKNQDLSIILMKSLHQRWNMEEDIKNLYL